MSRHYEMDNALYQGFSSYLSMEVCKAINNYIYIRGCTTIIDCSDQASLRITLRRLHRASPALICRLNYTVINDVTGLGTRVA